jgi:hydroxymethylpyrimidine pyrophosphatase-like HAD family hydrolase
MTIAVDFDGTIVEHKYPEIGKEKPFAIETLKSLQDDGHKIILWTSREGELLQAAIDFCKERGFVFYSVNSIYPEGFMFKKAEGRKIVADLYIDDRNLGGLPDWGTIYRMINEKLTLSDIARERLGHTHSSERPKKKHWWQV